MIARNHTHAPPCLQVEPEHLLLGMIAISSTSGFFGCKVSIEAAKREVQSALSPGKIRPPASPHQKDPEFSVHAKKLFETAQVVSYRPVTCYHTSQIPPSCSCSHMASHLHFVSLELCIAVTSNAAGVKEDWYEYNHS